MPKKKGLDYFPLDVDFFLSDKVEYISAKFGHEGELLIIKLLCSIYREGYYTVWNDDRAAIFAHRSCGVDPKFANAVVTELLHRGFFSLSVFSKYGVLTSRGIQRRFLTASLRRNEVELIEEYWLADIPKGNSRMTIILRNLSGTETKRMRPLRRNIPSGENEVREYCREIGSSIDPTKFINYYEMNGWRSKSGPLKDWKAAVRYWSKNEERFAARSDFGEDELQAIRWMKEYHETKNQADAAKGEVT